MYICGPAMRTRLKRITAFILLLPALTPVLYILIFNIHQFSIRLEMEHELENHALQTITLPANELHWTRNGKEIILDGKMFDVKAVEYNAEGKALVTGLFDHEETLLIELLQRDQEEEDDATSGEQLTNLLPLVLALPASLIHENKTCLLHEGTGFPVNDMALSSVFKKILTPPPQV